MAVTKISDIIVPEVFGDYVVQATSARSALIQSGVAVIDPTIQALANGGGAFVDLPFFNDLTGDAEVLSDSSSLSVNPFTGGDDVAVKLFRGKAWAGNDLVNALAGADPMQALANKVADYWSVQEQKSLIATLQGVFAGPLADTHVHDVSATAGLSGSVILDAKQKLGDAGSSIVAIAMHSAKYTELQKENLIAFITNSQGVVNIPTYLGYRVIVDDACPLNTGVYTSYLFSAGAIAYADCPIANAIEFDRNSLASQDVMLTRKGFITHVRGVKWGVSDRNPSNAGLATGANWTQVYEDKNIRTVAILTK